MRPCDQLPYLAQVSWLAVPLSSLTTFSFFFFPCTKDHFLGIFWRTVEAATERRRDNHLTSSFPASMFGSHLMLNEEFAGNWPPHPLFIGHNVMHCEDHLQNKISDSTLIAMPYFTPPPPQKKVDPWNWGWPDRYLVFRLQACPIPIRFFRNSEYPVIGKCLWDLTLFWLGHLIDPHF